MTHDNAAPDNETVEAAMAYALRLFWESGCTAGQVVFAVDAMYGEVVVDEIRRRLEVVREGGAS